VVKKVGGGDIKSRVTVFDTFVDDGRRQVGLAAAAGTTEYQPAIRIGGVLLSGFKGTTETLLARFVAASTLRLYIIEGEARQRTQVAIPLESCPAFAVLFLFDTTAGYDTAVVRFSRGQPGMNDTGTPADWTVRVYRSLFISGGPCVRTFL